MSERGTATLLVANTGGHLEQLFRLSKRFVPAPDPVEWATFDTGQSRDLLRGQVVHYVPFIEPKDLRAAAANLPAAIRILRRGRYVRVVSTGAAIAVPFFLAARALRIPCHYIESSARSEGPSLSGKLVSRIPGVRLYSQYPGWAAGRWQYRGAVFDGFTAASPVEVPLPGSLKRVVVSFGTQRGFPFRSAAQALARVVPQLCAPEAEILWQTGWTEVGDLGIDGVESVPGAELREAIAAADLVIAHAGVGTALTTLEHGRCPVLIPRRHSRGEHTDDHQPLIAAELDRRGLAVRCEVDEVTVEALLRAASLRAAPVGDPDPFLLQPA